jgi:hypothetical protein
MQSRRHNRYQLDAPVSFIWTDVRGDQHMGTGQARDIGLGGVFIFTQARPSLEASIHIELELPRLHSEARNLVVQGDGHVIRVEPGGLNGMGCGFAASIKRLFVRGRDKALTEDEFPSPCRLAT